MIGRFKKLPNNYLALICFFIIFVSYLTFRTWKGVTFFYCDEWYFLNDITNGTFNILHTHNEHFVPFHKLVYSNLAQIFSYNSNYLQVTNLFIHVINSLIVGLILKSITNKKTFLFLGMFIFALHPLQFENLMWNFQITITLNMFFYLLSFLFLIRFIKDNKNSSFGVSIVLLTIQNYFFGLGLIFYPLHLIFFILLDLKNKNYKRHIKHYVILFALSLINGVIYMLVKPENSNSFKGMLENIGKIKEYFIFTSYNYIFEIIAPFYKFNSLEKKVFFFLLISLIIAGFLALYVKKKTVDVYIIIAVVFYLSIVFFIALSRYQFGPEQGLASRYAYYCIFAILVVFARILNNFIEKAEFKYEAILLLLLIPFYIAFIPSSINYQKSMSSLHQHNLEEANKSVEDPEYDADYVNACSVTDQEVRNIMIKINE